MKKEAGMPERLQKILSACGVASRRQAEQLLRAGRVKINGAVASLGDQGELGKDTITVDGVALRPPETHTYLMLHKPRGYVTTLSDEKGRKTVKELVEDCGVRVYPVGRLDLDSEGLLLLTDDGAFAHRLTHPSHEIKKEYLVWVRGDVERGLSILRAPMCLDGVPLAPARVQLRRKGETSLLSVAIHQGKNRQVRRMCAQAGLQVIRLKRIAMGPVCLGSLKKGTWRSLTPEELDALKQNQGKRKKF
jgi:23S rRNA pseudouridine2605 synthase